jgi:ribosomal protein L22
MIGDAIKDLEQVTVLRKPVPMKGEIPHRKGKIMSGRFPTKAAKEFIILLKSLQANAIQHDLEYPIISLSIANKGTTVYGGKGRTQKKRTNVKIVAIEKKQKEKKK